jgi:hypothetical protein
MRVIQTDTRTRVHTQTHVYRYACRYIINAIKECEMREIDGSSLGVSVEKRVRNVKAAKMPAFTINARLTYAARLTYTRLAESIFFEFLRRARTNAQIWRGRSSR